MPKPDLLELNKVMGILISFGLEMEKICKISPYKRVQLHKRIISTKSLVDEVKDNSQPNLPRSDSVKVKLRDVTVLYSNSRAYPMFEVEYS